MVVYLWLNQFTTWSFFIKIMCLVLKLHLNWWFHYDVFKFKARIYLRSEESNFLLLHDNRRQTDHVQKFPKPRRLAECLKSWINSQKKDLGISNFIRECLEMCNETSYHASRIGEFVLDIRGIPCNFRLRICKLQISIIRTTDKIWSK